MAKILLVIGVLVLVLQGCANDIGRHKAVDACAGGVWAMIRGKACVCKAETTGNIENIDLTYDGTTCVIKTTEERDEVSDQRPQQPDSPGI